MNQMKSVGIHYVGPINDGFSYSLMTCLLAYRTVNIENFVLYLSSTGGSLASSYAAYSYLKSAPFRVITVNTGTIESAAVYLYLAGDERYYLPESRFMIHPPTWTFESKAVSYPILRDALLYLEQIRNDCNKIFLSRTSGASELLDIERFTTSQSITLTGRAIEASAIGTRSISETDLFSLAPSHSRLLLRHAPGEVKPGIQT